MQISSAETDDLSGVRLSISRALRCRRKVAHTVRSVCGLRSAPKFVVEKVEAIERGDLKIGHGLIDRIANVIQTLEGDVSNVLGCNPYYSIACFRYALIQKKSDLFTVIRLPDRSGYDRHFGTVRRSRKDQA